MLLTCSLPFLVTKGSRVLEKKVNGAQVSNTVFSHLNFKRSIEHYCSTQARCSRRLELACVKTHIVYPVFSEDKFGINYDKYLKKKLFLFLPVLNKFPYKLHMSANMESLSGNHIRTWSKLSSTYSKLLETTSRMPSNASNTWQQTCHYVLRQMSTSR